MFANHLQSVFSTNTKDVCGSVGTIFIGTFVLLHVHGKIFLYVAINFYVKAGAIGSSFSPGSLKVRGKINFPNLFANTMFASVYAVLCVVWGYEDTNDEKWLASKHTEKCKIPNLYGWDISLSDNYY